VLHVIGVERFDGLTMQWDDQLTPSLLIEEKIKRRALFSAEWPPFFELLNFLIGP
jgi:hypothetical protein